ncbi:hypothetical protein [Micromonospora yangpuensis]|uniref:Uncharacterized protein n=1 Tax=Micromonospora yangpuensis TaxID=683228 RepID=A0A1C6U9B9_9ACTN|nr:hypothetical protein [Micromonospora yangpuensis]GGL88968.1 hypothetical protein GCM10012279_03200 [Micromonospora yangpuensis]SCL50491.1 hypothetical protein GA0070617_1498 [Micromonospora yangpuensis]
MSRTGPAVRYRRLARTALVVAGVLGTVLGTAAPAVAHGADAPAGTDYRTGITGVAPARDGVSVRAIEAGARLELTNRSDRPVEVIGYSGEPYLRVGPDGAFENVHSPATYLNRTIAGGTVLPAEADPQAAPQWRRIAEEPTVRWHDRRALWREAEPPAQVRAAPDRVHRVRDWVIPLRDGTEPAELRGTLDWVPPPDPYPWWVGVTVGLLAVGALGLVPAGTRAGARALAGIGGLLAAGGLAAGVLIIGREVDAGAEGVGGVLVGLLSGQIWPLLTGLGALVAGGYALARRPAADFTLALAGTCLALFAGIGNAAVFTRSVVPVPWPAQSARILTALLLAAGAGAAAAGILRLRTAAAAAAAAAEAGSGRAAEGAADTAEGRAEGAADTAAEAGTVGDAGTVGGEPAAVRAGG